MNPPPQWLPTDWVVRAFESMGFEWRSRRWAHAFARGDVIFVFPEVPPYGFDVFHLFRNAKVHGIDVELWTALVNQEDPPPSPAA